MELTKSQFFIEAMKAGRLKEKEWILKAFSIVSPKKTEVLLNAEESKPFEITPIRVSETGHIGTGIKYFFTGHNGEEVHITDYSPSLNSPEPIYRLKERIEIKKGDISNLTKSSLDTNYGNLLTNWLLLAYPFGDIIPYMEGRFSIGDVEKIIEKKLTSEPLDGKYEKGVMYVSMYNVYRKAASLIAGLSQLCVPSASEKSMTTHPDMEKLKQELLKKYEGRLSDPSVIAAIEAEMIKLDADWLKGDISEGFLINKKQRTVIRKKSHMWMGLETAFKEGADGDLISTNLEDGIDLKDMVLISNNLREGSFDRGAETALGGDEVKKMLEIMQNSTVAEKDCGTKLGFDMILTPSLSSMCIGQYIFEGQKQTLLTEENVNSYIGKRISLRTTYFCKTPKNNVCEKCVGTTYAKHPTGIPTAISGVGSKFMYIFMGSMHAKALETAEFDFKRHIN